MYLIIRRFLLIVSIFIIQAPLAFASDWVMVEAKAIIPTPVGGTSDGEYVCGGNVYISGNIFGKYTVIFNKLYRFANENERDNAPICNKMYDIFHEIISTRKYAKKINQKKIWVNLIPNFEDVNSFVSLSSPYNK